MKTKYLSLLLLLSFPTFLFAQLDVIASGEALYNSTYSLTNGAIMGATIESSSKTKGTTKSGTKSTAKKSTTAKLNFVRSEPLSQSIQKNFIANLSKENSSYQPALEKIFHQNKLRNEFDRMLAGYGYSGKNLADAMTAYLVINWQIVHGQEYNDRRGFDAARKMIREHLLSSAYLKNATDQDKQTVAETFAYQSMIAMNTYKTFVATKKHAELEEFKTSIDNNLKKSGFDLRALRLTTNGFVKR